MSNDLNDKELADAVVAHGVGKYDGPEYYYLMSLQDAYEFVRDWRVAGALMEKCSKLPDYTRNKLVDAIGCALVYSRECTSRAIIEACVEALK
jgi:hypothetical protein